MIFTSFHNEESTVSLRRSSCGSWFSPQYDRQGDGPSPEDDDRWVFSPQKQDLLSASPETPSVAKTYTNAKRGRLQFVLSFADRGLDSNSVFAALKAALTGGRSIHFHNDVEQRRTWRLDYKVTAEKIPYPNFPVHADYQEQSDPEQSRWSRYARRLALSHREEGMHRWGGAYCLRRPVYGVGPILQVSLSGCPCLEAQNRDGYSSVAAGNRSPTSRAEV